MTTSEALSLGLQHHEAGRLSEAEKIYHQILQLEPNHPEALHLLGLLAHQAGRYALAVDYIGRALALDPANPELHNNIGEAYRAQGNVTEALAHYQKALALNPNYAEAHNNLGNALKDGGSLEEALAHYQKALALNPNYAQPPNNIGTVLYEQGKLEKAIIFYRRALTINPAFAQAHNNLGVALQKRGKLESALGHYRQALALDPSYAEAHNNLSVALLDQGNLDEAADHARRLLALKSAFADAHYILGIVLKAQGLLAEAVAHYKQALALKPKDASLHENLALALKEQGELPEALLHYQEVVALKPNNPDAYNNLGLILQEQGRLQEAEMQYQQAIALRPIFAEAHNNLGVVLAQQGKLLCAETHYREAMGLLPDSPQVHNNLGNALKEQGKLVEAVACYQKALNLKPEYADAYLNLGSALKDQGELAEAVACYRKALAIEPGLAEAENQLMYQSLHICKWTGIDLLIERQRHRLTSQTTARISPFTILAIPSSPAEQLTCARNWVANRLTPVARLRDGLKFHFSRTRKPRLRIGYLSADFHEHATAYLITELLEMHDRGRVEIFAYSFGPEDASAIRRRIVRACDRFASIRAASYLEAAQQIHQDGVDILVDLKGYTKSARTEILALRPAPIQVNYLGYPGTMGADFIDYLITDKLITPPEHAPFFTEKLVYLPDCYQANDRQREVADPPPTRTECGLPEAGFVFCAFNNTFKIIPEIFSIWMRLLQALPSSVLWILEANPDVVGNLRKEAQARGIPSERLVFAPRTPLPYHLARQRQADLFLDTFPYTGHTTTSDALWVGLPVLTCIGETFASRVAGSLLTAIGLPELITYSLAEYEARALHLAHHPRELAALRARLRQNRLTAPLFDTPRFTRHLECAYRTMWEIYMGEEAPRQFAVTEPNRS